jgi:hypothetical protein
MQPRLGIAVKSGNHVSIEPDARRNTRRNNVLVPVAVVIAERSEAGTVSTPEVCELLGGRLHPNRVGKALARLDRLGALTELPFPGRPHARMFNVIDGPFWTFVRAWALDPEVRSSDS